jgi:restriction system protein
MSIPGFQELTLPVLREYEDRADHSTREVRDRIAQRLLLTEEELREPLPSRRALKYANRVAWAHTYLKQAQLLESPSRGFYRITERGLEVLKSPPGRIDIPFLMQYPEMAEWRRRRGGDEDEERATVVGGDASATVELTPDEQIMAGYRRLRESLAAQLLAQVKQASPEFFEGLVVKLLLAMGYGGSHEDAARTVGRTGDGGIDGIIKEDRLGLESIYLQAKRWEGTVGRPIIQQFAGALQGRRARKGVLITTSNFSRDAVDFAGGLQTTIVLVDGPQLAQLMIDYGVGVSDVETIRLKRMDEDFFAEE